MGEAMNYDGYAKRYREDRFAVSWILEPLARHCERLVPGQHVIEVGSGTGNYVLALWDRFAALRFHGLDRSTGMLEQARARAAEPERARRTTTVEWREGNADERLPYSDDFAHFVFLVDVIHHIERQDILFFESARVLAPGAEVWIVSDSPSDILARSLSRYFPETLEIERRRYPAPEHLDALAIGAGLERRAPISSHGELALTPDFVDKIANRCASALRLLTDEAHERGMQRVRQAALEGERWQSHYTLYRYQKPSSCTP